MCMPKPDFASSKLKMTSCTIDGEKRREFFSSSIVTSSSSSLKKVRVEFSSSIKTGSGSQFRAELLLKNYGLYTARKNLQKIEFFAYWLIAFMMMGTNMGIELPVIWLKLSVFTRAFAYAVDFTNAYVKLNGSIPMWLVFYFTTLECWQCMS